MRARPTRICRLQCCDQPTLFACWMAKACTLKTGRARAVPAHMTGSRYTRTALPAQSSHRSRPARRPCWFAGAQAKVESVAATRKQRVQCARRRCAVARATLNTCSKRDTKYAPVEPARLTIRVLAHAFALLAHHRNLTAPVCQSTAAGAQERSQGRRKRPPPGLSPVNIALFDG